MMCGCCGNGLDPSENVAEEGMCDEGVGMCKDCGGDPKGKTIKKKIGRAGCMFYEARFEVLEKKLGKEAKEKFEEMSYEQKIYIVQGLIKKGVMI